VPLVVLSALAVLLVDNWLLVVVFCPVVELLCAWAPGDAASRSANIVATLKAEIREASVFMGSLVCMRTALSFATACQRSAPWVRSVRLARQASLNQRLRTNYPGRHLASGYPQKWRWRCRNSAADDGRPPSGGRYNQVPVNNLRNDPAQLYRI
jgi:hypothetical protein